ncbi:MAG: hypothetical protein A2152_03850 [Candidatus Levybacteria bacterium RBG_16_35_6]|nr:MAG: hypothetical protein A2152_03850 [Candidatus Levybacteria bacterium RBG_16_35_6]
MVSDKQAVLKTLKYADLFNCPQREVDIKKFLIKKIGNKKLKKILSSPGISNSCGFYFLKGRKKIVSLKKAREKESLLKLKKARKISFFLSKIPSIMLLGISGSVAAKNAKAKDDIDFFVITYKNTLWITRFLMIVFLKTLGIYRNKGDKIVKDKFCLNMYLTESSMTFKKNRRNIYTAREICQLIPLFQRENAYSKFIFKNAWIKEFLPNAPSILKKENKNIKSARKSLFGKKVLSLLELPVRELQLRKIRKGLTKETLSYNFIAFHPRDLMNPTLNRYNKYPGVFNTRGY